MDKKVAENHKKTLPDFEFYLANRASWLKNPAYYGKHLVIKDRAIVGAFDGLGSAIRHMNAQGIRMGNYIVQLVHEEDDTNLYLGARVMSH